MIHGKVALIINDCTNNQQALAYHESSYLMA
jgi:hypothetical protein